jgi:hypothetical protein
MGSEIREIPYVGIDFSAIHKTDFSACPLPKRNFLSLSQKELLSLHFTGQMLSYLRALEIDRPKIWD